MSWQEAEDPIPHCHITLTMVNQRGLHARAAAKFVRTAEQFGADITVSKDGHSVSGKSIMGLLMLAATHGSSVEVELTGADAKEAANALAALVDNGFGEVD